MSQLVFCICAFLFYCRNFNPSLCHLLPFQLSYVTVFKAMSLVGIYPNRAMFLYIITQFEDIPGTVLCYLFLNSGTQFLFVTYN